MGSLNLVLTPKIHTSDCFIIKSSYILLLSQVYMTRQNIEFDSLPVGGFDMINDESRAEINLADFDIVLSLTVL